MAKSSSPIPKSPILKAAEKTKRFGARAPAILRWYDANARDLPWRTPPHVKLAGERPDAYSVWLSEVMLQQTTVPAVKEYFLKFTSLWPTVFDLAAAPSGDVMAAWAGLGYYARARNLHACAKMVTAEYGGVFPKTAAELQKLPGIGPYTSAAIAAICYDEQVGVLDGNVERVLARFLALEQPVRNVKVQLREILDKTVPKRAGDYAQALMDIGATICAPKKAICDICPLQKNCAGTLTPDPTIYPIAMPKVPKPQRFGHVFLIENSKGQVCVRRRPPKGLLGGMHEFVGSDWLDKAVEPDFPVDADWVQHGEVKHVFTHFALYLKVWSITHDGAVDHENAGELEWVDAKRLDELALPSLFKKVAVKAKYL